MSDRPDDLVLTLLRAISADMAEMKAHMIEIKERFGLIKAQYSSVSRRVDRLAGDMERVKRRLDLHDAPA